MRVFVTGATGFIGSSVVRELLGAGHEVLGLARSDEGAAALAAAGASVQRGSLHDLESLRRGAVDSDGVIHLAFIHDFSDQAKFIENCEVDRQAIEVLGSALEGSSRPLVITSGTALANTPPGRPSREDDPPLGPDIIPRGASETAAAAMVERGLNVSIVRLPQVHDEVKQGLVTYLIKIAREKGVFAYVGDGRNRWPAAPVADTARLYRLALEKHAPGARYHAVAEEGVALRDIAEVVGPGMKLPVTSVSPEEAPGHFGWLAMFTGRDFPASGAQTQERLNWKPTGPTLLADLARMDYSKT